jgi:FixJ family two-component response regulator
MNEETYYSAFSRRERMVHIVDPDLETCETLSVVFRLEGFQTMFSINLRAFLASLERRRPDAVIANLDLGPDDGFELLRRVKSLRTGTPVFLIENRPLVDVAVRAIKAGAADVVTKPIDTEFIVRAVHDALNQDVHPGAMPSHRRAVEVRGFAQLTPREREVLQLIAQGQSNKEAGRELGISPRTIEVHRARVMEKLGAKNTADLMRIVLTS